MKKLLNQTILGITVALAGLAFSSCSGGGGGESGENGDFSQDGSSGGVPAPSQLKAGQTIVFKLPTSVSGFSQNESFRIVSSYQADRDGSPSLRGKYTYTTNGSSATFRYQYVSSSSDIINRYVSTDRTYQVKFTSSTSGIITGATIVENLGINPKPVTYRSGTFEIR